MKREIYGNQCLLVTPMNEDETVDEKSTEKLINHIIENGVHGVLIQGSTGEGFLFDTDERKAFMDLVVQYIDGRVPVGFTIESSSTSVAVDLAKYAAKSNIDYLFTTPPFRHPHKDPGIYEHFKAINDSTDLPVAIYDGGAGIELGLGLLEKISQHLDNIKFCKVYLEKPEKVVQISDATQGKIIPWAGHDRLSYLMLRYGAPAMTSAASCILPRENTNMFNYIQTGEIEKARQIYLQMVCPLNAMAFYTVLDYIAAYKMALYFMGIIETPTVRKPLVQLDSIMQNELREALRLIGKL